jgi:hypothetical protein
MIDRYTKAVLTVMAVALVAPVIKDTATHFFGTNPLPPATNPPAPATNPPVPGTAESTPHPVVGAPRAFGRVLTFPPLGSHVILSKNVVSVLHPSPGVFCIVLAPEILANEAVMVATLHQLSVSPARLSVSHIETHQNN